jgi:crotonobetainyl-CoA:carnitine CoA-transferase CaiB-like acyl-CoA transferase
MAEQQANLLQSLKVVDLSLGMAGALATRLLGDAGARITRLEPEGGDPFYDVYPAYAVWQRGKTIAKAAPDSPDIAAALADADACVIGGDDYPGVVWSFDADALARAYPKLVILHIGSNPQGTAAAGRPAVELLSQARAGLVFEHHSDRPMRYALPAGSYGAALHGVVGLLGALCEQKKSGTGQVVRTSLYEGNLAWMGHFWFTAERSNPSFDFVVPKDTTPLIFKCGDGRYVHITTGTTGAKAHLYGLLGIDEPSLVQDSRGLPSLARGPRNFYGEIDRLQSYISSWKSTDLLHKLWALGLPAEAVNFPGEAWDDAQVVHNGIIAREADGVRRVGLPIRFRAEEDAPARPASKEAPGDAPALKGLRIVDFGNFTAGPHSPMLLGDLGADVIKVEPLTGDPARAFYRPFTTSSRGKRNLAVDMKNPKGLAIVQDLCRRADIVTHNFRPGVTKRLGIDADALRAMKPELIVQENSGYGADGPNAGRGGLDMIFQAFCGHEQHAAGEGNDPICYRATTVDFGAGIIGTIGILMAQYRKLESGTGAEISTSLLNTGLYFLSEQVQYADGSFSPMPRLNHAQTGFHPAEQIYAAKDGWIAIAARGEDMAKKLVGALDLGSGITSPAKSWGAAEEKLIAGAVSGWNAQTLLAKLESAGVWAEFCVDNALEQFASDPVLNKANIALRSQDPDLGEVMQIGQLFSLSRSHMPTKGDSPRLGEDSRAVLAELGYSATEIDTLFAERVVA